MVADWDTGPTGREVRAERLSLLASACFAILVALGSFETWSRATLVSSRGFDGDGRYTLALALLAGVLVAARYVDKSRRWYFDLSSVTGLCVVVIAIINAVNIRGENRRVSGRLVEVSVGGGLWLVLAGGVGLVASALLGFWLARSADW